VQLTQLAAGAANMEPTTSLANSDCLCFKLAQFIAAAVWRAVASRWLLLRGGKRHIITYDVRFAAIDFGL
jgi:hypothetical protein